MSEELIDKVSIKLGLYDELKTQAKAKELLRLLDLRSTNSVQPIGEYPKIVICIDLAANLLNVGIDPENLLKVSGLRKTVYLNHKRMIEKILDLNRPLTINDICLKLGVQELCTKAKELLAVYKNYVEVTEDEILHPQYSTMAVYQASKIRKYKISKQKITSLSHLKPVQWTNLEKKWDKFINENPNLKADLSLETKIKVKKSEENQRPTPPVTAKKAAVAIEPYEDWKARIIAYASAKLALMEKRQH